MYTIRTFFIRRNAHGVPAGIPVEEVPWDYHGPLGWSTLTLSINLGTTEYNRITGILDTVARARGGLQVQLTVNDHTEIVDAAIIPQAAGPGTGNNAAGPTNQ